MTDTVREQIIQAVVTKLADIRTANQYNTECGSNVKRVRKRFDPDSELPAIGVWPGTETSDQEYGAGMNRMAMRLEGHKAHGSSNPSAIAEEMLGDLIECMMGVEWSLDYDSGGTYQVSAGDTIEGHDSGATALVIAVGKDSGTWAGGDAAGTLTLRRLTEDFQDNETLDVGANLNVATVDGSISGENAAETTTAGLAEEINYVGGGPEDYPEEGELVTAVAAEFEIIYGMGKGDPYH